MLSSLRTRIMLQLALVVALSLSATFLLRTLIIQDFGKYMDGETQDRIQHVISMLELHREQQKSWQNEALRDDLVWALMMGLETRVVDRSGRVIQDTQSALNLLESASKRRVLSNLEYDVTASRDVFVVYPLFYKGDEIGRLEVRSLRPAKEEFFISSSNRFLVYTVFALGALALALSFLAARRLSRPLQELSQASSEIAFGNLSRRVTVAGPRELVSLATSFNRMVDALEAQEKLRRRLVSSAAHELRTPLAIISGELEGMIDGVLPVNREGLQSMHDEAVRLTSVLNGIDDLTRAEAGSVSLQYETIELKPLLEAIVGRFQRLYDEKRAVILLDCPVGLQLHVDPDRLSQIIINLISNSHRAIATGGRTVVHAASEQSGVHISVSDNGSGIALEDQTHIFERFFKGHKGGLGLGLAIVKELVAAHGGTIDVRSCPGEGAVFTVSLPDTGGGGQERV